MNAITQAGTIDEYLEPELFLDHKGQAKRSYEKSQRKLLSKIAPLVRFFEAGEKVRLITVATSPMTAMEQLTTGSIIYYVKRCLLIFTGRRVLHIPSDYFLRYRHSVAEIRYENCKSMRLSWGQLVVEFGSGSVEKFANVDSGQRKKLKKLLSELPWTPETPSVSSKARTHLCPRCTKPLENDRYTCPSCLLEFRDKETARKISWLVPGGGYFYTGHPILGVFDAIVESFLLISILVNAFGPRGEQEVALLAILAAFLGIEKVTTVYHSKHYLGDFIPKGRLE